ncbi:lipocalin family protein [Capnocytophaga cynodegmi]|uniref:lipocalin family protein n=1 Tax=Capnocytophaga cynodegmi TaxID=28189 RepID=UPI00385ABCEA
MKKLLVSLIFIILVSCNQQIKESDLQHLNGYWEIEKVVMPDKSTKEYKVNTTYDYIEIKNSEGFRKKVYPQLTGNFQTNDDSEVFKITKEDNVFKMNYENGENQWTEILELVNETSFVVKNEANITYHYKKVKN